MIRVGMTDKRCMFICPQCGSTRIHLVAGGMTGYLYRCRECDYQGPIRLEANDEMVRALREKYEKNKDVGGNGENGAGL